MANITRMTPSRHSGLGSTVSEEGQEAAAQTYKQGAILIPSSGLLAVGGSDPSAETILGIAEQDATGTTNEPARFIPATPQQEFEANIVGTGGAGALNTVEATDLYAPFGIVKTGDNFLVDKDETTALRVVVTALIDAIGEANGRVRFRFLPLGTVQGQNIT